MDTLSYKTISANKETAKKEYASAKAEGTLVSYAEIEK